MLLQLQLFNFDGGMLAIWGCLRRHRLNCNMTRCHMQGCQRLGIHVQVETGIASRDRRESFNLNAARLGFDGSFLHRLRVQVAQWLPHSAEVDLANQKAVLRIDKYATHCEGSLKLPGAECQP